MRRKAPKETGARFAAYVVQWTLGKRRCKGAVPPLEEFAKGALETMLAPAKEAAALEALATECEASDVVLRIRTALMPEATHADALVTCRGAVQVMTTSCLWMARETAVRSECRGPSSRCAGRMQVLVAALLEARALFKEQVRMPTDDHRCALSTLDGL